MLSRLFEPAAKKSLMQGIPVLVATLSLALGVGAGEAKAVITEHVPADIAPTPMPAPAAAAQSDTTPAAPLQLALGDSWAAGGGAQAGGYVPRLNEALKEDLNCSGAAPDHAEAGCPQLQLLNLALGGATVPSMVKDQFPDALALLASRNGDRNPRDDVELVTLHIGGNDVANPVIRNCLRLRTENCQGTLDTRLAAYRSDLDGALSALRQAAGDDAPIVIGTYDNPWAVCILARQFPGEATPLADVVLEGGSLVLSDESLVVERGLNDIMREVGARYDVRVAEVFGDLAPGDWLGDCLHPNPSGQEIVKDAFLEALGLA